MLDELHDPDPSPSQFAHLIAARAAARGESHVDLTSWLRTWHDREGTWTQLRNLEHWIGRSVPGRGRG